jgi:hypothetical protein
MPILQAAGAMETGQFAVKQFPATFRISFSIAKETFRSPSNSDTWKDLAIQASQGKGMFCLHDV